MKNKKLWFKMGLYSLLIAGATFAYPSYNRELNVRMMQANSFNSSSVILESQNTFDRVIGRGDKSMAAYNIVFTDATGLGALESVKVKLTAMNGASFKERSQESSVLNKLPQGLQLWRDKNGNKKFDTTDQRMLTRFTNSYENDGHSSSYVLQLENSQPLHSRDVYFLVFEPTHKNVTKGQGFQMGIPANGIKTTALSPTTSEVLTSAFVY